MKRSKILFIAAVLIVLLGFGAALFHQHHSEEQFHFCAACHYVKQLTPIHFILILLAALFFSQEKLFLFFSRFYSFLVLSSLQNRAPPEVLS